MRLPWKKQKLENLEAVHTHTHTHGKLIKLIKSIKMLGIILAIIVAGIISILIKNKNWKIDISGIDRKQIYAILEENMTTIDLTGLVTGADTNHTHIYEHKYDDNNHWEECFICHDRKNTAPHKKQIIGTNSCNYNISQQREYCTDGCGYNKYLERKAHNVSGWKTANHRYAHYTICQNADCQRWIDFGNCTNSNGERLGCLTGKTGVCQTCGYNYTTTNHVMLMDGECYGCGMKMADITYTKTIKSQSSVVFLIKITPRVSNISFNTNNAVASYLSIAGNYVITNRYNDGTSYIIELTCNLTDNLPTVGENYFEVSGITYTYNSTVDEGVLIGIRGLKTDNFEPQCVSAEIKKDNEVNNYSKKATVTAKFSDTWESPNNSVDIRLLDSDKETVIADWGTAEREGTNYTRIFDIVAEASEEKSLYLQARDACGNLSSMKEIRISNIDAKAPTLVTKQKEYNQEWSKEKIVTFEIKDEGIGQVEVAFNNENNYISTEQMEENTTYKKEYKFIGDVYKDVTGALYMKDELGNSKTEKIVIGKLDNTAPTISNVTKTVTQGKKQVNLNVESNDYCEKVSAEGSGVTGYSISKDESEPGSFQNTNNLSITENGTYYVWIKDLVGNISEPREIVINEIESTLTINPNGGTWDGNNDIQKFTLKDKGTKDIPDPTREGHVFSRWQIEGEESTLIDGVLTIGTKDITLTAQWEAWSTNVTVTKVDSETRRNIKGATFKLLEWNGTDYQENSTLTDNEDGTYSKKITYTDTNKGRFRVIEETAPDGYYGDWTDTNKTAKKTNDVTITEENNGREVVISNNEKGTYENKRVTGTINVSKIDKEKGKYETQGDATLNGAEYGLYAAEEINHKDTETGKIYEEGDLVQRRNIVNGTLKFDKVEIGNYYIKEIKAPKGYVLDETEYPIEIEYEGEGIDHIEKSLVLEEQVIKQGFKIEKLSVNSANEEGSPLAGAGFKVYLISSLSKVKNGEITADGNENYTGEQFKEYNFEGEETAKYYEKNKETKILEEKTLEELFTDTEGHITFPELPYGKYVVIESTVPAERYVVDPIIVDIREDSREAQDYRYLLDEEFEALIKINKYDSTTGEKVLNKTAGYRIWDVNNERYVEQKIANLEGLTVGTEENPYRINEEGYIITPLEIQIGEYELEEVEAPEGYVKQGYEGKIENGVETKTPKDKVRFTVTEKGVYYQDTELGCLVINVNQYNDPMVGELKVTKEGKKLVGIEEKENGTIDFKYEIKPIEGTQFEVYAKEDIYTQDGQEELLYEKDEKVGDITTNARGIGYVNNLPIGKYYVKEIEAGEGFTLNKSIKEFEIKYQGEEKATQSVTIDYVNEKQSIDINDNRGLIIEKVTDRVVYKPGEEVIYIIKVSNTGDVEASNIVVTENRVNGEFIELDEEKVRQESEKVVIVNSLEPGESIELKYRTQLKELDEIDEKLEITNIVDAKGEVTVPDPENPGEDKKEDVEAEDKKDIVVTDKKLVVVKEAVKDSYAPGEIAQYLVKVVNNGTEEIKDIEVKETLLGGSFVEIEEARKNGIDVEYGKEESGEDNLNKVIINKIGAKETITLRYEYKVPTDQEGLKILGNTVKVTGKIVKENPEDPEHPIEEVVEDEASKDIEVKEDDNGLGIIKKDIETGERIEGAEIGLYAGEDIKTEEGIVLIEKDTLIEKTITNEQGKAIFTVNLPLGMYYAQEITAPRGYLLSTERIDIDLNYKGQNEETITISRVLTDRSRKVKIEKEDEKGNLIEGALLEVIDEEGNKVEEWKTEKEGRIINKLDIEKIYTLREISPSKGYTTANEIKFYIGEDEKLYQIIKDETKENQQEQEDAEENNKVQEVDYIIMKDNKTKIKIEIKDKETEENVPGIEVDIVDKETGKVVDTVVTTEDGAEIEGLPIGDYELRIEDSDGKGYVTGKEDITVEDSLEKQKYEIEADYTKIEIEIKDGETDKLLLGGKIEIIDKDGNIVAKIEENNNKIDRLPPGKYILHETEAPKGYWTSEDVEIEIKDTGEKQKFTLINIEKTFDIQVEKIDEEENLLEGAILEVVNEDGKQIEEWETNKEKHVIKKLDDEKIYTLKEISPVKGYTTANEIKFYIGEDEKLYQLIEETKNDKEQKNKEQQEDKKTEEDKVQNKTNSIEVDHIIMKDSKTKIKIEVKDKETGENVPGIKVDIVDKKTGEVVDTVVTTEDGAEIEGVPIGDYEVRTEDTDGIGYVTDRTDITVEDILEEQKYEFNSDYTKIEIGIKDEEQDKLLPGGKIEVLDEEETVVAEIETEEDMSKLDRLPPGKYTLHQTEAPKGYRSSEDVEIEIKNTGEVQSFTLTNRRKIFDMQVEKRLVKQVYNGVETNITGELSKFEIRPQNIPSAEFWTIYTVTVRNVGEIAGKATVKELVPDGFEMFQDSNLQWKVEGKEATLKTEEIEPGESKEYEVVLRWNQHVLNIGMKQNKAVIISTENEFGFKDEINNDNNSSASILVTLSTGLEKYFENVMYVMLAISIIGTISIVIIEIYSNKRNKQ